MGKMNKQDLEKLIAEAVGKETAELRKEILDQPVRRHTHDLLTPNPKDLPLAEKPVGLMDANEKSLMAGRCVRYLCSAQGNRIHAAELAEKAGDKNIAKALGESTLAGGGALLPPEFASGVVEFLRAKTVVLESGVTVLPMNGGSLTLPFQGGGATSAYTGENQNTTSSQPNFGQLQLSDKKLRTVVPTSNDLLRNGGASVDRIIRDDMVKSMANRMDLALIRGDGSSNTPKGLLFHAVAGNKFNASATFNLDNATIDLTKAILKVKEKNVDLTGGPTGTSGWLFSTRTETALRRLRDGNGNLAFKDEMDRGLLWGFPFRVTTQIPENLGGGTDESEIYFAAFDVTVLGENESIIVEVFPGGSYFDGSSVISGISQDQTIFASTALHDFGARQRGNEIAVIQAVKWGS
jgi:HK97 family phage major capsid protein